MWRTIIINQGEKISTKDNWLVIHSNDQEQRVPIDDIYSVVIENRAALVSVAAITVLTQAGVHVFYCDNTHIPVSVTLPLNNHYRPFAVVKNQLNLSDEMKGLLWQKIIRRKILNQCECLALVGIANEKIEPIRKLAYNVMPNDKGNLEGITARKYFKTLFGAAFTRNDNDITNAALNYGYAIIRSAVSKTLIGYGYNCVIGIHHINEQNPFNLADDIMEPLRPLVDLWTDNNCNNLYDELTKTNRNELINLVNVPIMWDRKKMRVRYAIDKYISSLTTAIEKGDPELLKIPHLIKIGTLFEDDEDG